MESEDGPEALRTFSEVRPDIVLLDVIMPNMDGFQTCAAVRRLQGGAQVPIVMMTGLDDVVSIQRAFEAGATDFITKPFDLMILSHRVKYMHRANANVERLRVNETRQEALLNVIPDVMLRIGRDGILLEHQGTDSGEFGFCGPCHAGAKLSDLMPMEVASPALTCVVHALDTRSMQVFEYQQERGGSLHCFEVRVVVCGDDEVLAIIRDVTERKAHETALREAERNKEYRDMLERFNQELETLVAERTMNLLAMTLADRVRNPASVIGATANRILRKEDFSDKTKEHMSLIRDEAEKLDKTVKDFQNLLTNRQTLFNYEDICSIVRDVLPVVEQEALRKHITVTLELPERQMKINTERNLLKMAIFTLLKNAVELTPDEGRVTVSVSGDDNSIRLVVADNGYGMPQEEIDAVCDPNTQLQSCRFGLGLPLIKQILAEHMGEISVISEIGKGAKVTLTFPVRWSGIPHVLSLPAV